MCNTHTHLQKIKEGHLGSSTMTAEKYMLVTPYMMMKILASDRLLKQ